jgi:Mn2+/Fe2+ NRAMP family transporter
MAYLLVMAPGIITASAGNDAGGIATYAHAGAAYGYGMLWAMVVTAVSLIVVQEMCARMGAVTGKGLADLIREEFAIGWVFVAMLGLLVANGAITVSEFIGVAACAGIAHLPVPVVVPLVGLGVWLLVTRGPSSVVQRVFLGLTVIFFAYIPAAFLAKPNWADVLHGTLVPNLSAQGTYLADLIALVGTTISPYMQLYVQSSVVDDGITPRDYPLTRAGVVSGSIFAILVACFIIIATGATLYGTPGAANINDAGQFAVALEPFLHEYALPLFGAGLFGASLLAAAVLPLSTAYAVCEMFGFESGLSRKFDDAPVFYGLLTALIAIGVLIASLPRLPLVDVLLKLQALNGVVLALLLVFIVRLVNMREIMGKYVNGRVYNVLAYATAVLLILLSVLYIIGLFGIGPAA